VELLAPCSTPNLEHQWTTLSPAPILWPICLAWVTLPGAYAPASIALGVIRARKPPTCSMCFDKAVVLGEVLQIPYTT